MIDWTKQLKMYTPRLVSHPHKIIKRCASPKKMSRADLESIISSFNHHTNLLILHNSAFKNKVPFLKTVTTRTVFSKVEQQL